jgi:hypothetical protein
MFCILLHPGVNPEGLAPSLKWRRGEKQGLGEKQAIDSVARHKSVITWYQIQAWAFSLCCFQREVVENGA